MLRTAVLVLAIGGACGTSDDTTGDRGDSDGDADAGAAPITVASWWAPSLPDDVDVAATLADVALAEGAVLLVGDFEAGMDFGAGPLDTPDDQPDGYIARLSYPAFEVEWVQASGVPGDDRWASVTILPSGDAVAVQWLRPDPGSSGPSSARLVRMSADSGQESWSTTIAPTGGDSRHVRPDSLAATPEGTIILSGTFEGELAVDGVSVASAGCCSDTFVLAFDGGGRAIWGFAEGVSSADYWSYVSLDPASGDVLVSGAQGSPKRYLYAARLAADTGAKRWSRTVSTTSDASGFRGVGDGTSLYIAGHKGGDLVLDEEIGPVDAGPKLVASFRAEDGAIQWAAARPSSRGGEFVGVTHHDDRVIACGEDECIWLADDSGELQRSWVLDAYQAFLTVDLVDPQGRLLVAGASYGPITVDGEVSNAGAFGFRPVLLVLQGF